MPPPRRLPGGLPRWFRGDGEGTIYYLDENEEEVALPRPSDYATQPYVLTISASTGLPIWAIAVGVTFGGLGMRLGAALGQD